MRITTFGAFALAVTMMTAGPLMAQSANRTGAGAPVPPAKASATLAIEAADVTKCRVHCQNLPQLGVGHSARNVAEFQARYTECAKKMIVR